MSAYNGSGVFVISGLGLPYVTGTTISSTVVNQLNTDFATGLSNCICKDGQSTPVANIPMGGYKVTGIGAATTLGDALSYGRAGNVSTLGIGMTPVNILDIQANANNAQAGVIQNLSNGTGAVTAWAAKNDAGKQLSMQMQSSGYTTSGAFKQNGALIYTDGVGGLCLESMNGTIQLWYNNNLFMSSDNLNTNFTSDLACAHLTAQGSGGGFVRMTGFGNTRTDQTNQIFTNDGNGLKVSCHSNSDYSIGVVLIDGGTSWQSYSSMAQKKDIIAIPGDPLARIGQLSGYLFHYISEVSSEPLRIGLMYEDAVNAIPWATRYAAASEQTWTDDNGVEHTNNIPESKTLSLEQCVPLLVDGVKALTARISSLEARLLAAGIP
jgi:hypothetical protein